MADLGLLEHPRWMERFAIIVNGFQPSTIIPKRSILDVAAVLDLPLGTVLKLCKVLKYYDQNYLNNFFLLFAFPIKIQISGKKSLFGSKKLFRSKKLPVSKVVSFLKSDFKLNQICKIVLTQNH